MLVLSRKPNEKLIINGDVVLTIVRISGNAVRIGIEAPNEVKVYREEVLEKLQAKAALANREDAERHQAHGETD